MTSPQRPDPCTRDGARLIWVGWMACVAALYGVDWRLALGTAGLSAIGLGLGLIWNE